MIVDSLNNANLYRSLSPRIALAFDWLLRPDVMSCATGTYEIDGRQVYAIVQEYETSCRTLGTWEAHRRYIDLQFVVAGAERIGYVHMKRLTPGDFDQARDLQLFSGEGDYLTLRPGDFMLLFPEDAHQPGVADGAPEIVRKVVVKIAVSP